MKKAKLGESINDKDLPEAEGIDVYNEIRSNLESLGFTWEESGGIVNVISKEGIAWNFSAPKKTAKKQNS